MAVILSAFAVLGGIAALMTVLVWLAGHARRRGTAGAAIAGAMAAYDEAFHSTAHDSYVEVQEQDERMTPIPSPSNNRGNRPSAIERPARKAGG